MFTFSPLFSFYIPFFFFFLGISVITTIVSLRFLVKYFCSPVLETNPLELGLPPICCYISCNSPIFLHRSCLKRKKNLKWFCFFHSFLLICTINQDKSLLFLTVCGHINMYLWLSLILIGLKYWQKYMTWEYLSWNCNLVEVFLIIYSG